MLVKNKLNNISTPSALSHTGTKMRKHIHSVIDTHTSVTHKHSYTHIDSCTNRLNHTHSVKHNTYTYNQSLIVTHTQTQSQTHTPPHKRSLTQTQSHTYSRTHTCLQLDTFSHICCHKNTQSQRHSDKNML